VREGGRAEVCVFLFVVVAFGGYLSNLPLKAKAGLCVVCVCDCKRVCVYVCMCSCGPWGGCMAHTTCPRE